MCQEAERQFAPLGSIKQASGTECRCLHNPLFCSGVVTHKLTGSVPLDCEPGSSVSTVSDYGMDERVIEVRSPAETRIFPLASVFRPAMGPTQPPVQWVPGVLSPGLHSGRGVTLTTQPI
jgi:hypothetical protein